jgi:hypothetical protein
MEKNKMLISGMIPGSSLTLSRIEIVKWQLKPLVFLGAK